MLVHLVPVQCDAGHSLRNCLHLRQAKQRYNERVLKGVSGFLALRGFLEGGDIDAVRGFFTSEDIGGWKDFSAAGYLLSNAFRRNSSTPPDSLPAVKVGFPILFDAATRLIVSSAFSPEMESFRCRS